MNLAQGVLTLIILGLVALGAYAMHWFFGLVGVGFFALFMVPMFGVLYWVLANSDDGGGGATTGTNRRRSKGARED